MENFILDNDAMIVFVGYLPLITTSLWLTFTSPLGFAIYKFHVFFTVLES